MPNVLWNSGVASPYPSKRSALIVASALFSTLGERTRLKIFMALADREACVCDIAASLDITVSLASHHLRKMRDGGLLKPRSEGKLVYYSLREDRNIALLLEFSQKLLDPLGTQASCYEAGQRINAFPDEKVRVRYGK